MPSILSRPERHQSDEAFHRVMQRSIELCSNARRSSSRLTYNAPVAASTPAIIATPPHPQFWGHGPSAPAPMPLFANNMPVPSSMPASIMAQPSPQPWGCEVSAPPRMYTPAYNLPLEASAMGSVMAPPPLQFRRHDMSAPAPMPPSPLACDPPFALPTTTMAQPPSQFSGYDTSAPALSAGIWLQQEQGRYTPVGSGQQLAMDWQQNTGDVLQSPMPCLPVQTPAEEISNGQFASVGQQMVADDGVQQTDPPAPTSTEATGRESSIRAILESARLGFLQNTGAAAGPPVKESERLVLTEGQTLEAFLEADLARLVGRA